MIQRYSIPDVPSATSPLNRVLYAVVIALFLSDLVFFHGDQALFSIAKTAALILGTLSILDLGGNWRSGFPRPMGATIVVLSSASLILAIYAIHGLLRGPPSEPVMAARVVAGVGLGLLVALSWRIRPDRMEHAALGIIATAILGTGMSCWQMVTGLGTIRITAPELYEFYLGNDLRFFLPRASGLFTDPNYASVIFAAGLSVVLTIGRRHLGTGWTCSLGIILTSAAFATRSRMGLILLFAIILLSFGRTKTAVLFLGGTVAFVLGLSLALPGALRVLNEAGTNGVSVTNYDSSARTRIRALNHALGEIRSHPVYGIGPGATAASIPGSPHPINSHNTLLDIGAETGLPGLLGISVILGIGAWASIRTMTRSSSDDQRLLAALVACAGVSSLFLVQQHSKNFWLLLLPPLILLLAPQNTKPDPPHA